MRISGHLCVYIQAVAPIVHQNLALNNMSFKILCFKTVREPLVLVALRGLLIDILIIKERSFKQKKRAKIRLLFCCRKSSVDCQKAENVESFFLVYGKKVPFVVRQYKTSHIFLWWRRRSSELLQKCKTWHLLCQMSPMNQLFQRMKQ